MRDQTLQAIDQSVVTAAEFLQEFASDEKKRECLRAFAECQKIVQWIRKETRSLSSQQLQHCDTSGVILPISLLYTDVTGLQNFVNISLATAAGGEDDFTRDKLSSLRIVGSGFEALIYRLLPTAGYTTLVERCRSLWDILRSTPQLPKLMVHTCL